MSISSQSATIYADADVSFRDIFSKGKLGGRQGLIKYLEFRQNQLTRSLSDGTLDEAKKASVMIGIAAMRGAINLVDLLGKKPV